MIFVYWIPMLIESWLDRAGETKRGKVKDFWWTLVGSVIITGLAWLCFGKNPFTSALMILVWRFCTFDYITNFLLKKYSEGHSDINVFTFTGTTAFTDRLTAKIHPVLRLVIRIAVFGLAVWWYL